MERIISDKKRKFLSTIYASMDLREILVCIENERSVFVLVDENAYAANEQLRGIVENFQALHIPVKKLKTSETLKSMETVLKVCQWLLEHNADRSSLLLGIGGGILTDMAGFAASIYMRGIRFAYVPTTLLAQVDASVGGKTGVNFKGFKNMLGVIRQPEFTFISPVFLKSLPRREFLSGAAELLKTFIISNENGAYGRAVLLLSCMASSVEPDRFRNAIARYQQELYRLVSEAVQIKMEIVSADQFESGERRKLNLGHTFAHAIEHCAAMTKLGSTGKNSRKAAAGLEEVDITHGEAVAMGLVLAAGMSEKQGTAPEGFQEQIESDLKTCGLETECPFEKIELMEAMKHDKKADGAYVNFVLMRSVGNVLVKPVRLGSR